MSVNFNELLNKRVTDAVRPPPMPAGTYHGIISRYEFGESAQKHTPYLRCFVRLTHADESISPDSLVGINFPREMRRDFFLTEDALFRLREFLESCGINLESKLFNEAIPDIINAPVLAQVTQRNATVDGKPEIFNDINALSGTGGAH